MVSIIVPVYNVQTYLNKCVSTLIEQTYSDLQIILVDDGSTDLSPQICENFAGLDNRIEVIHKTNGGLSDARNEGINRAKGDYLCFVDSDDYISSFMIEKMILAAEESNADVVVCGYITVEENGDLLSNSLSSFSIEESSKAMERLALSQNGISVVWNKLYKRKVFDGCFFPVGKIHEDEFIMHRVIGKSEKWCYIPDCLYYYVMRNNSITANKRSLNHVDKCYAYIDRYYYFSEHGFEHLKKNALQQCYGAFVSELKYHSFFKHKNLYLPVFSFLLNNMHYFTRKIVVIISIFSSFYFD